jgi:hypothetical protein
VNLAQIGAAALIGVASAAPAQTTLDMPAFFTGRTHAENVLHVTLHKPAPLIVDSVGTTDGKSFTLTDTVNEQGKPPQTRKWVMHPVGPNHFTGTLSDATGPVGIAVAGNTATIRYTMKGGLQVVQTLTLQPDGRSLSNQTVVRKFGLKFATVQGTVRKLD